MSQRYKGHDVLLQAVADCRSRSSADIRVVLVGDGIERRKLEELSLRLGLADVARFTGHLSERSAVEAELDHADAFILASRQEGLPRAMIEAMARGLPCLGTRVGGIPELLDEDALFAVDDHRALARLIDTRLRDAAWMTAASERNLTLARTYRQELLRERRGRFYRAVFDATARWQAQR